MGEENFSIEGKEKLFISYTAEFVSDIDSLLNIFPPKHKKIFGHHSTIAYKPSSLDGIELGRKSKLKIIGHTHDDKGDVVLVENPKSVKKNPHITISCAEGVSPVYSDELIEKSIMDGTVEYFTEPIEIDVTEGYSDGKKDILN